MNKKRIKTKTVYQKDKSECAVACLSMLMQKFGKIVPYDTIYDKSATSPDGCSANMILKCAEEYGFNAEARRISAQSLVSEHRIPCMVHLQHNHFVVFEGIKKKFAYINDPLTGSRKMSLDEFNENYSGVALIITPGMMFEKSKKKSFFKLFFEKIKNQGQIFTMLALISICIAISAIFLPIFLHLFFDEVLLAQNSGAFLFIICGVLCSLLIQAGLLFCRKKVLIRLQNKLSIVSSHTLLSHILKLPINYLTRKSTHINNLISHSDEAYNFIAGKFFETIISLFSCIIYAVVLAIYSSTIAAAGILLFLIILSISMLLSKRISALSPKVINDEDVLNENIAASIRSISEIKASATENIASEKALDAYAASVISRQKLEKNQMILKVIPFISIQLGVIISLFLGALEVLNGSFSEGAVIACMALTVMLLSPASMLCALIEDIQRAKSALTLTDDLIERNQDNLFKENSWKLLSGEKLSGRIEANNITFGYNKSEKPVIENINISALSGEHIAIVGACASGKSTIANLLGSLYTPDSGEIFVDDVNLRRVPPEIICSSISYVRQNTSLFCASIRDNITMGNENIKDEDILQASIDACIHCEITKMDGAYNHILSDGGSNLSAGQRQRIEIAKALATNPTILILDEATNCIDDIVTKKIMKNIKRRGCTCIIISNRVSEIKNCSEIFVVENGRILQQGSDEYLACASTAYQQLINEEMEAVK